MLRAPPGHYDLQLRNFRHWLAKTGRWLRKAREIAFVPLDAYKGPRSCEEETDVVGQDFVPSIAAAPTQTARPFLVAFVITAVALLILQQAYRCYFSCVLARTGRTKAWSPSNVLTMPYSRQVLRSTGSNTKLK